MAPPEGGRTADEPGHEPSNCLRVPRGAREPSGTELPSNVFGGPLFDPTQCIWYPHEGESCCTCTVASNPLALNWPVMEVLKLPPTTRAGVEKWPVRSTEPG